MPRTTKSQLEQTLKVINNYGFSFHFDWISNRPRVVDANERDVSPRLSKGEMAAWLSAFETGLYEQRLALQA